MDEENIHSAEEKTHAVDDLGKVHHSATLSGSVGVFVYVVVVDSCRLY